MESKNDDHRKIFRLAFTPSGKPFEIYAPGWNEKQIWTAYEKLGSLDTWQSFYITTSQEQLIAVLEYLQEGAPSP